jgi:CheY-like chemotaxis protein
MELAQELGCRDMDERPQVNGTQPAPYLQSSELQPAPLATVIASTPGIAEQSLRVMLEALPWVDIVGMAAGCLSALEMVREKRAELVVIDSNVPIEDVQALLRQLKQERLSARSLVLASTRDHVRRALAAGADFALRRDIPLWRLSAVVAGFAPACPGEADDSRQQLKGGTTE